MLQLYWEILVKGLLKCFTFFTNILFGFRRFNFFLDAQASLVPTPGGQPNLGNACILGASGLAIPPLAREDVELGLIIHLYIFP